MLFFDATFDSGGILEISHDWIHPTRTIDNNEIIYVIKGHVCMFEENKMFDLHKGDCIILEKGKLHGGYEHTHGCAFYWLHFNTDFDGLSSMKHTAFRASDSLSTLFQQLIHSALTPSYSKQATDCFLRLVLNEIYIASLNDANSSYPVCGDISDWIMRNSDRKISVDEISEKFGYNKDYISRVFRKHFGMSLKSFIDNERIKYIKSLLMTTSYSLKQISSLTGFPDYKSFLKFFSYHDNTTPMEYRQKYFASNHIQFIGGTQNEQ